MLMRTASQVKAAGAQILRGDAFKPRTSPYSFQGLGEEGLKYLAEARDEFGLPFVAEVLDSRDVALVSSYADIIRIGTRNMSNFALLGRGWAPAPAGDAQARLHRHSRGVAQRRRVHLQGGEPPDPARWSGASEPSKQPPATPSTSSAVPLVKQMSHLPILVDPSHSGGLRELVGPLARAAAGVGADGIMVDVHPAPDTAKVDGAQALLALGVCRDDEVGVGGRLRPPFLASCPQQPSSVPV